MTKTFSIHLYILTKIAVYGLYNRGHVKRKRGLENEKSRMETIFTGNCGSILMQSGNSRMLSIDSFLFCGGVSGGIREKFSVYRSFGRAGGISAHDGYCKVWDVHFIYCGGHPAFRVGGQALLHCGGGLICGGRDPCPVCVWGNL